MFRSFMTPPIHLVIGATASGKSAAALALAREHNGVIINADSQQLYSDLRILTARPSALEEAEVPHRLYGIVSGAEAASVGLWLKQAKMEIDWAHAEGLTPMVTGGTGMYVSALIAGMAEIPDVPEAVRAQAEGDMKAMGKPAFFERLQAVDAASAEKIGAHNTQRLVRAYSVWLATGKPLSYWQAQGNKPFYPRESFAIHHIELPREELYARCDARFDAMVQAGAMEEVRALQQNYGAQIPQALLKIIGVRELLDVLEGNASFADASARAKQATRNYAKRQLTWFRNQLP
jgi:tRNA dimethylallyltransferase